MGIVVASIIVAFAMVFAALFALWATSRQKDERIAQLEKRVSIDSFAFAHQARIHHQKLQMLDSRMQYMARDMVSRDEIAKTWHGQSVDRDRITRS